jgi:hypothetical protein
MKAIPSSKMLGTNHSTRQYHIPEAWNPQMPCNLTIITHNFVVCKQLPIYCLHLSDFTYMRILINTENDFNNTFRMETRCKQKGE